MADRWLKYLTFVKQRALSRPVTYNPEAIREAHRLLGNPGDRYAWIHVTGTNGKGSYCSKMAYLLQASGIRSGLFTSPHIGTIRERTVVDGLMIDKDFCVDFLARMMKLHNPVWESLTFFDFQVLMALEYFKDQGVEVAVIEVGIGGRMDSTNISKSTMLSAITGIGLDHTEILGGDLASILGKDKSDQTTK